MRSKLNNKYDSPVITFIINHPIVCDLVVIIFIPIKKKYTVIAISNVFIITLNYLFVFFISVTENFSELFLKSLLYYLLYKPE